MSRVDDIVRMKTGFIERQSGSWIVLAVLMAGQLTAQETLEPTWRQGVSRWTGGGYGFPAAPVSSPEPVSSAAPLLRPLPLAMPERAETPYVLPVDPNSMPTWRGFDAPLPQAPVFVLPSRDNEPVLELASPAAQLPPAPIPESILPPPASEPSPRQSPEKEDVLEIDEPPVVESLDESIAPQSEEEVIADEVITEEAPLDEEVTRWYQYPRRWMRGWDSHAELGLDGSTGNARTVALQTGLELKRETERQILALDIDYRQASNRSVTTEDNGRLNLDYDRMLFDTPWSGFAKFGMEWDKFKAFDLRLNVNSGLGYHWIRRDDASLVTRFGAGASKEIGAPDDDWIPEAVFGAAAERQITSRQKLKGKIDYFPAWEDFSNFRLVSDVAWEILLDGVDNLSLKLAATDRYDSTPQGAKKNDLYYSLLLLYKF